jgi:gustatory receptor
MLFRFPFLVRSVPYLINKIYVSYALIVLIVRMLAVYIFASNVNKSAMLPLRILKYLPISRNFIEVYKIILLVAYQTVNSFVFSFWQLSRYYNQLRHDQVALSGMDIFTFTRGIILSVIGTIITYQIVMIQNEFSTHYRNSTISKCEFIAKLQDNIVLNRG